MSSPATLFLLPLFAVTFGYEPSPDADTGYDYIVQVEPELVERMHAGDLPAIEANVPPEVTPIRRIRLVIGTDDLPRDLRMTHVSTAESGPVTRTANRENLDGALLAQTGPAGGFGRSSTGFSGQGRTTPAISNQPAAPAVGNSPVDIRRQVESGFENAAQSQFNQTRDAVRGTVNDIGQRGQQAIDNGRQLLSDVVAPPENRNFDAQNRPLENLANRTREELRDAGQAVRDSVDRTGQRLQDFAGNSATGNGPAVNPMVPPVSNEHREPTIAEWRAEQERQRYAQQQQQRSVLVDNQTSRQPAADSRTNDYRGQDYRNRDYRNQNNQDQDYRGRDNGINTRTVATDANDLRFPEPPPQEYGNNGSSDIVAPLVNRTESSQGNGGNLVPLPGSEPAFSDWDRDRQFAAAREQSFRNPTNDWLRGGVEEQQSFVTGGGAGNDAFAVPEIADPQLVSNDMGQGNAIGSGQGNMQANGAGTTNVPAEGPSMPFWVLGCAVAIGSVVGNMYQWLNIVDLRNKYRVALRRTSPSFARSMAS